MLIRIDTPPVASQQWGDDHLPHPDGPSMLRRRKGSASALHVGYIDDEGHEVTLIVVRMIPAAAPGGPAAEPH